MSELRRIMTVLNDLEREFDLFSLTVDDAPIWDYIRPEVWKRLRQRSGDGGGRTESSHDWDYVGLSSELSRNLIRHNPVFAGESDVLFHGFNRRLLLDNDRWWCPHCDPIANELTDDWAYLESPRMQLEFLQDGRFHRKPVETDSIYYTDWFSIVGPAIEFVGIGRQLESYLCPTLPDELRAVQDRLESAFNTGIDLASLLREATLRRKIERPAYDAILDRVGPDVVVTVNRPAKLPFIEACYHRGIPTIELQQGAIHDCHPAYSYPISRRLPTIPEYYFTFGEFWNEVVDLPIPESNVVAVGWPYLEDEASQYDDRDTREYITVLSQPMIGAQLAEFAVGVATLLDDSHDVVFRPHPNVGDQAAQRYPILSNSPVSIGDPEQPLYELFSRSSAQIGVSSTALFEGLWFDLQTFVLEYTTSEYTEALVTAGYATRVNSPDEVATDIGNQSSEARRDNSCHDIFERNAIEKTLDGIETVKRRASQSDS